jgi:hypothetical protein
LRATLITGPETGAFSSDVDTISRNKTKPKIRAQIGIDAANAEHSIVPRHRRSRSAMFDLH